MVTALSLAALFALRSTLLVLYVGVLFALWGPARAFVRSGDPGDCMAIGVWLITAGAMCANISTMGLMVLELGTFHGSIATTMLALSGLWAGFFLIWNAWVSANYELTFRRAAAYSAAFLVSVAIVSGAVFFAAVLTLV